MTIIITSLLWLDRRVYSDGISGASAAQLLVDFYLPVVAIASSRIVRLSPE